MPVPHPPPWPSLVGQEAKVTGRRRGQKAITHTSGGWDLGLGPSCKPAVLVSGPTLHPWPELGTFQGWGPSGGMQPCFLTFWKALCATAVGQEGESEAALCSRKACAGHTAGVGCGCGFGLQRVSRILPGGREGRTE